jgi:hypothetical protein
VEPLPGRLGGGQGLKLFSEDDRIRHTPTVSLRASFGEGRRAAEAVLPCADDPASEGFMSADHSAHGHADHASNEDSNPLVEALTVVLPVLGVLGGYAFVVFLLVKASVHH